MAVIAGGDPMDSTSAAVSVPDYPQGLDAPVKGLRIGVPTDYFAEGLDSAVREKVEAGISLLERLGCRRTPLRSGTPSPPRPHPKSAPSDRRSDSPASK